MFVCSDIPVMTSIISTISADLASSLPTVADMDFTSSELTKRFSLRPAITELPSFV
jgi:hypothetical protein